MNHVSAAIFALAAAAAMLGVAAGRHDDLNPVRTAGGRGPYGQASGQPGLVEGLVGSPSGGRWPGVVGDLRGSGTLAKADRLRIASEEPAEMPLVWPPLDPPDPPKLMEAHDKPAVDPICGKKGRTWYTKHGWKYWRCVR